MRVWEASFCSLPWKSTVEFCIIPLDGCVFAPCPETFHFGGLLMKLKPNRLLSMLLALALIVGLVPANTFAAANGRERVISADAELITLFDEEIGAPTYTDVCYFSDDWFLEDSAKTNPHLATLTAIVGGVSFTRLSARRDRHPPRLCGRGLPLRRLGNHRRDGEGP